MSKLDDPQDDKYFGLKDYQFDLAVFIVIGAIVGAFFFLGGVGAAEDIIDGEAPSRRAAVVKPVTPVASLVVQAQTTSDEASTSASAASEAPAPSQPESEPAPAPLPASKPSSGGFNVLPWLVGIVGVIVVMIFQQSVHRSKAPPE